MIKSQLFPFEPVSKNYIFLSRRIMKKVKYDATYFSREFSISWGTFEI